MDELKVDPQTFIYDQGDQHKHLDFIQGAISRLAGNSFLLKGWSLTLSSAIMGLSVTREDAKLALVALIPVVAFWALDAFFLRQERAFRKIYEAAVAKIIPPFEIKPAKYAKNIPYFGTAFSISLVVFYGALCFVSAALFLVLLSTQAPPKEDSVDAGTPLPNPVCHALCHQCSI